MLMYKTLFLFSIFKRSTNKKCQLQHPCQKYGKDAYSWCYTVDGSWDYCSEKGPIEVTGTVLLDHKGLTSTKKTISLWWCSEIALQKVCLDNRFVHRCTQGEGVRSEKLSHKNAIKWDKIEPVLPVLNHHFIPNACIKFFRLFLSVG